MPEVPAPPADRTGRPTRRTLARILVVVLAVAAVIAAIALVRGGLGSDERPTSVPTTPPPYPEAPMTRLDSASLTVPADTRFAQETFWARAGETYLVTFEAGGTKPEESGGRSMYLGITFSCSPQVGGPGINVGGTQNVLTGETLEYVNQGLISVPEDGAIDCSIRANAPYNDVASAGATVPLTGSWHAERVTGEAASASTDDLPMTIPAGEKATVLTEDLQLDENLGGKLQAMAALHLTACTVVNGSREDGRAWCAEDDLDETGSTATMDLTAQLLDEHGEVCEDLGAVSTDPDHIDLYRHHRLLSLDLTEELPTDLCGTTLRVTTAVQNDGPAPLVVHRSNSSLVGVAG